MGHEISEKKKREHLIKIIKSYLETALFTMKLQHDIAPTKKDKLICNKAITNIVNARIRIDQIKHIELLEYIYNYLVSGNLYIMSISGALIMSKKVKNWDTDKGIIEYKEEQEIYRNKVMQENEEKRKQMEMVKKAQEEGKQVEFILDEKTKKLKPVILEENEKA